MRQVAVTGLGAISPLGIGFLSLNLDITIANINRGQTFVDAPYRR